MEFRSYSTKESAKRALRKEGLHLVPVKFELTAANRVGRSKVMPVLQFNLAEDVQEANRRGFKAVLIVGATFS